VKESKRLFAVASAIMVLAAPVAAGEWHFDGVERIVAISDIHGAYDAMVKTLAHAGVIDADGAWAGGATHLVITGDILDRGADSRPAMDMLMRLETEAPAAGGRVHVLIGNHEAMNLTGDLRYVSIGEYASFAADESSEERELWRQVYAEKSAAGGSELTAEAFAQRFPPGFFAHRRAFRADGEYGGWLLSKPVIVVINGTAFVHGGIHPGVVDTGLRGLNGKLVADLRKYVSLMGTLTDAGVLLPSDGLRDHENRLDNFMPGVNTTAEVLKAIDAMERLQEDSLPELDEPLWYRGNVGCSRVIEERRLESALEAIGASRVVIGHTPTDSRQVLQRFDGMIVEIDTGMLNTYYDGKGHALVIEGDDVSVVSEAGAEFEDPLLHPRRVGQRAPELTTAALEILLSGGEIIAREERRQPQLPRTTVKVSDGEHTVDAIFVKRAKKGVYPNVAAYRLDQLLGLGMVPVTVVREVDGKDGSLHFLPEKTIDEQTRSTNGRGGSAWCPLNDQWRAMYVFDALIYNQGRGLGRMLYAQDRFQLILIEHQNSFLARKGLPKHLESAPIEVTAGWREALEALPPERLSEELGDVLDKGRLKALNSRRKFLLTPANGR
jgi:hypothetical protein